MLQLNVKLFKTADEEWLDFILMCREKGGLPHSFDLVIGPTADDDTMVCLNSYWRSFYGVVGSDEAKEKLLGFLETDSYLNAALDAEFEKKRRRFVRLYK